MIKLLGEKIWQIRSQRLHCQELNCSYAPKYTEIYVDSSSATWAGEMKCQQQYVGFGAST